jgi:hypothetical protein
LAKQLRWRSQPASGDYTAAGDYLALLLPEAEVRRVVARLKRAATSRHKPKDIERATGIQLLPADDPEVQVEVKKSRKGKALGPILLVRGSLGEGRPLVIADGYHRICAGYYVNQDAEIPCRVADLR